jgi:hypothetical protein
MNRKKVLPSVPERTSSATSESGVSTPDKSFNSRILTKVNDNGGNRLSIICCNKSKNCISISRTGFVSGAAFCFSGNSRGAACDERRQTYCARYDFVHRPAVQGFKNSKIQEFPPGVPCMQILPFTPYAAYNAAKPSSGVGSDFCTPYETLDRRRFELSSAARTLSIIDRNTHTYL